MLEIAHHVGEAIGLETVVTIRVPRGLLGAAGVSPKRTR